MARAGRLTSKQEQFVQCLLSHHTVVAAAKICTISERTAYRWHADPILQERLQQARREAYANTMDGLVSLVNSAVLHLAKVYKDDEAGHALKLRADALILDYAHKHMVDLEVDERLRRIEEALEGGP